MKIRTYGSIQCNMISLDTVYIISNWLVFSISLLFLFALNQCKPAGLIIRNCVFVYINSIFYCLYCGRFCVVCTFITSFCSSLDRVLGQPLFVCITPPNYTSVTTGNIRIELMDTRSEYRSTSPYDFNYLPNPVIESIANPTTFLR